MSIFNPYNLTDVGKPLIWYRARHARTCTTAAWMLSVKGSRFKGVPWYDHGDLSFQSGTDRDAALAAAIAKAKELFPDEEMVKGPWRNTWVCKSALDAAKASLKAREEDGDGQRDDG